MASRHRPHLNIPLLRRKHLTALPVDVVDPEYLAHTIRTVHEWGLQIEIQLREIEAALDKKVDKELGI